MSALTKAREQLQAARKSAAAQRLKREAGKRMDVAVAGVAGAVIGHLERNGKRIPKLIAGVPVPAKAQWALVLAYAGDRMSGEMKQRAHQAATAMATLAGYESAIAGKLVEGK